MKGQRMAPHAPQESPKVKTERLNVGSCVFTLSCSLLPRARAYVNGTLKKIPLK